MDVALVLHGSKSLEYLASAPSKRTDCASSSRI